MASDFKTLRSLALYHEKVSPDDYKEIFRKLMDSNYPILGLVDLSWAYASAFNLVVKKKGNSLSLFVSGYPEIQAASSAFFPFRLCKEEVVAMEGGFNFPIPFIPSSKSNLLDLVTRENLKEISLKIRRMAGKTFATGIITYASGARRFVVVPNPHKFLEINLQKYPSLYIDILEPIPKEVCLESQNPIFLGERTEVGIENFDVCQHGLVVGMSGSGKSKFLELFIKAVLRKYGNDVRIIVIDPHSELPKSFPNAKLVDYKKNFIEPFDVGLENSPLVAQLISQLITSTVSSGSKYSERVNFYATHLLLSQNSLSVQNMNLLLTDEVFRSQRASMEENVEVKRFFDDEFKDIQMHYFDEAILPILNFVGEYNICINKQADVEKLGKVIAKNNLTLISFDPQFFGKRMIKFLAGAVMNQLYLMAVTEQMTKPTILIADEFAFVETPVAKEILSETRKFNLFLYPAVQYLEQLKKETLDAIVTNCKNIISFKTNKADAKILSSLMEIKVEEFFRERYSESELEVARNEMFTNLQMRECMTRLFDGRKFLIPMKLKTVDVPKAGLRDFEPSYPGGGSDSIRVVK